MLFQPNVNTQTSRSTSKYSGRFFSMNLKQSARFQFLLASLLIVIGMTIVGCGHSPVNSTGEQSGDTTQVVTNPINPNPISEPTPIIQKNKKQLLEDFKPSPETLIDAVLQVVPKSVAGKQALGGGTYSFDYNISFKEWSNPDSTLLAVHSEYVYWSPELYTFGYLTTFFELDDNDEFTKRLDLSQVNPGGTNFLAKIGIFLLEEVSGKPIEDDTYVWLERTDNPSLPSRAVKTEYGAAVVSGVTGEYVLVVGGTDKYEEYRSQPMDLKVGEGLLPVPINVRLKKTVPDPVSMLFKVQSADGFYLHDVLLVFTTEDTTIVPPKGYKTTQGSVYVELTPGVEYKVKGILGSGRTEELKFKPSKSESVERTLIMPNNSPSQLKYSYEKGGPRVSPNTEVVLRISDHFDPDGDPITVSYWSSSGRIDHINSDRFILKWKSPNELGEAQIRLRASDDKGLHSDTWVKIIIAPESPQVTAN